MMLSRSLSSAHYYFAVLLCTLHLSVRNHTPCDSEYIPYFAWMSNCHDFLNDFVECCTRSSYVAQGRKNSVN